MLRLIEVLTILAVGLVWGTALGAAVTRWIYRKAAWAAISAVHDFAGFMGGLA